MLMYVLGSIMLSKKISAYPNTCKLLLNSSLALNWIHGQGKAAKKFYL